MGSTQGGVALSLVPRSPSHNYRYEVRVLPTLSQILLLRRKTSHS